MKIILKSISNALMRWTIHESLKNEFCWYCLINRNVLIHNEVLSQEQVVDFDEWNNNKNQKDFKYDQVK